MSSTKPQYTSQYSASWGLVVGIDEYRHLQPLGTAVRGAQAVADCLQQGFGFEITELYNREAGRETILRWFSELRPNLDDRVIFYFAGHGVTRSLKNRSVGYLALANSDGYWNSLAMDEILDEADALQAKHVLYLIDACFSGIALRGREADFHVARTADYLLTRPARYAITAGGEEVVDDDAAGEYSLFTYWLLQGFVDKNLQADGLLRAKELGLYIEENVSAQRRSRALPNHGYLQGSGDGDFLFTWQTGPRLPSNLEIALIHEVAEVRWGAVAALINLAKSDDQQLVTIARERLQELAHTDTDLRVRGAAQSLFDEEEAIRLAEQDRIQREEARRRLEDAQRKQEETARAAREAEEELKLARRKEEEQRLLAEQAERERQAALQDALRRRQVSVSPPHEESRAVQASIREEVVPQSSPVRGLQKGIPGWTWGIITFVTIGGLVGFLALSGILRTDTPSTTPEPAEEVAQASQVSTHAPTELPSSVSASPTSRPTRTPNPTSTATSTSTSVPASAILYSEDFEDGEAQGWGTFVGSWTVEEDEDGNRFFLGTGPANYPQAWLESDYYDVTSWMDYAFQSRVRFVSGILFMCARSEDGGSRFYTFYIDSNNDWVSLSEYDPSQGVEWGGYDIGVNRMIRHNQWYTFRFELDADTLRLFIDEELVLATQANLPLVRESGGIGFYMGGGEEIHFDDILVWQLSSSA